MIPDPGALGLLGGQWVGVLDGAAKHDGVARTLAAFRALGEIKSIGFREESLSSSCIGS
jgi:hypothetical protein